MESFPCPQKMFLQASIPNSLEAHRLWMNEDSFIPKEDSILFESLRVIYVGFSLCVGSRVARTFISVGSFYSCKAFLFSQASTKVSLLWDKSWIKSICLYMPLPRGGY